MSDIIHKKQGIMKVIVYGLGIIGASVAASLKAAGHEVLGKNRSRESIVYALEHGMIDGEAYSLCEADVVFLALPPRVTMRVLDEGAFSDGCIVADICGVKAPVEEVVLKKPRAWRYVGTHPMAGKETSGIRSASAALFRGANFVMVKNAFTDPDAFFVVRALAQDMGFGRIVECSAAEHDKMIALTSQLAHVSIRRVCATRSGGSLPASGSSATPSPRGTRRRSAASCARARSATSNFSARNRAQTQDFA